MVLLFGKIVMGFIIYIVVDNLLVGEIEVIFYNNVKYYLRFG